MDNSTATSILGTLRTVEFRLGLKGYNVDEVDEYLEKAAIEAESIQEQLRAAQERLRQATERVGQLEVEAQRAQSARPPLVESPAPRGGDVSDDTLQRTLLMAQKFVEQTKRESEAEATETVRRAEERAQALLAQAEERARQVTTEAEERLRDEIQRLEGLRTRLAGEVESMTKHLRAERDKIRTSLTEALAWLDDRMKTTDTDGPDQRPEPPRVSGPASAPELAPTGSAPPAPARPPAPAAHPGGDAGAASSGNGAPGHSGGDRSHAAVGARLGVLGGDLFTSPPRSDR